VTALEHAAQLVRVEPADRGKTYEVWLVLPTGERTYLGSTHDASAANGCLRLHFTHLVAGILSTGAQLHARGEIDA
jgi:hypothetical protein